MVGLVSPFATPSQLVHEFFNGAIVAWSGLLSKIPRGWVLCDGDNGTPDLRDRFVRGAENQGKMRKTDGSLTHVHNNIGGSHRHSLKGGTDIAFSPGFDLLTLTAIPAFTTETATSEPDYYSVAYIMEWEGW